MDEKRLEKLIALFQVADTDTVSPDEVAQALEIVLGVIAELSNDVDARIGKGQGSFRGLVDGVLRKARLWRKESKLGVAGVRKIVDALVEWKKTVEKNTDVETLGDEVEEISDALAELRERVEEWKTKQGRPGRPGRPGKIPDHEWEGTRIRFENPDGEWGEWVDLMGPPGPGGGFFGFGGGPAGLFLGRITTLGSSGPATLSPDGTLNIPQYSGSGGGHVIEDEGTPLTQRAKLNFVGAGVTVTDDAGDDATVVTIPGGGGSGLASKAEVLAGSQSGADVELDTGDLSEAYTTILGVYRNGQLLTPTDDWTQAGAIITVFEADAGDAFVVSYTYSGASTTPTTEVLAGVQASANVDLDLTGLAHAYVEILGIYRNGYLQTPVSDWSQVGDVITVNNADAGDVFQVSYTY